MFKTKKQPIYEILLSVVISTRDRPGQVKIAVKSVLECLPKNCELTIVDQSEDDDTAAGLYPYKADSRFIYIRSRRSDVSAGRNKGLRRAGSKWIFITDDDCEIYLDTSTSVLERLRSNQYVGIVFGNVFAEPYNPLAGIIPTYIRKRPFLARNIRDKMNIEGLSACMVIRKSAGENLNGFDELLGAGASLKSGAETDFTIRCLLVGHPVMEIPEIRVIHHGFRNWEQCHMLAHRYCFGTGAAFSRCLVAGGFGVCVLMLRLFLRWVFGGRSHIAISLGRRQRNLRSVLWFTKGFIFAVGMMPLPKQMDRS